MRKQEAFAAAKRIGRNALFAAIARVIIGVLKYLAKKGFKGLLKNLLDDVMTLDPLKWACVVGGLSAFRLLSDSMHGIGFPKHLAALAGGCLAASPALVMNAKTRTELMLYALARALHCFVTTTVFPKLPVPVQQFQHYDTVVMMLTSSQILHSFLFLPKCHLESYQGFLVRATMVDRRVLAAAAGTQNSILTPELVDVAGERNIALPDIKSGETSFICNLFHPDKSCNHNSATFVLRHLSSFTMPLYFPLKLISTVVFHWKALLKSPAATLWKVVKSAARSSLFLTLYCAAAMRTICIFANLNVRNGCALAVVGGTASGIFTLLEEKGRRLDLAVYCVMQSIRSLTLSMWHGGLISLPTPRLQATVYITAMGYLFYNYDTAKDTLHVSVKRMFGLLLSEGEPRKEAEKKCDE